MNSQLEHLLSIPPIFDSLVINLPTFDLISLSQTSYTLHKLLKQSKVAWQYFTFNNWQDPPRPSYRYRSSNTTVLSATLTSHTHIHDIAIDPSHVNYGRLSHSFLPLDTILTVLGQTLPLRQFVMLDLSWTRTEEKALRQLIDHCSALEYLNIRMCPMRANQVLIALFGLEKKFVAALRESVDDTRSVPNSGQVKLVTNNGTSAVVEMLSRILEIKVDDNGNAYTEHWYEGRTVIIEEDARSIRNTGKYSFITKPRVLRHGEAAMVGLQVTIQDQLDFLKELTESVPLKQLTYLITNKIIEACDHEHFIAITSGCILQERPHKLRHLVTPKPNSKVSSADLRSAANDPEEYLALLCLCLGIQLHHDNNTFLQAVEERNLSQWAKSTSWLAADSVAQLESR